MKYLIILVILLNSNLFAEEAESIYTIDSLKILTLLKENHSDSLKLKKAAQKVIDKINQEKIRFSKLNKNSDNYTKEVKKLRKYISDSNKELKKESSKIYLSVKKKLDKEVNNYIREKNIKILLEKNIDVPGAAIYGSNKIDITNIIKKRLNLD